MIDFEFVVVTADMGTDSGCRFDWGGILIYFIFWLSKWVTESNWTCSFRGAEGGSDCIIGVRCEQRHGPSSGGVDCTRVGTEILHVDYVMSRYEVQVGGALWICAS